MCDVTIEEPVVSKGGTSKLFTYYISWIYLFCIGYPMELVGMKFDQTGSIKSRMVAIDVPASRQDTN